MSIRKSKTKSLAKKKADKYFSQYIRYKNSKNGVCQCVTCGKWHGVKSIHTGHFISRRYESTRYDEKNCAPQCVACNTFNQGKQYEFGLYIDEEYGKGTAEKLLQKSKMICKRKKFDYEFIAKEYKNKIEELE